MSKDANYNRMIHSRGWLELRRWKIQKNPLCEDCLASKIAKPATEVHHVVPVESACSIPEMERLMFNPNNLASLCSECHKKRHQLMGSHSKDYVKENMKKNVERFKERYL